MKTLLLSIFLIISSHCFAQDAATRDSVLRDSLKTAILAKAHNDPQYKKAMSDVSMLKSHIKLANEGKIQKATVVKEYNASIGRSFGQKQSFKDVVLKVSASGDDYTEYMLLTTEARIATEEAAKKTKKIESYQ
jgi:hypothetical protein